MIKSRIQGVSLLVVLALLSGHALAQVEHPDYQTNESSWVWGVAGQDTSNPHYIGGSLHRARGLIGSTIKNVDGKTLGTIRDLVLTPDCDNVSYVAVSTGGPFGIGGRLHAIPWSVVQTSVGGGIAVPISKQEFKQDPGFVSKSWPSKGNPRWLNRPGERTEQVTYDVTTAAESESIQNCRFSRIKGSEVRGPRDEEIGDIEDLVVTTGTGKVAYAIASFGGFMGLGEKCAAVPRNAAIFRPESRVARLSAGRETLEAHAFSPGAFPTLSDPLYTRGLNEAYGMEGPETVLGYVPPEEPATADHMTPPAREMAGPTEAELTGTFSPDHIATIEGTVTDFGKYKCSKTGVDVLWLRIRTDDGQIVTVNAGPRMYIAKQDFYVVKGDRVSLTGSDVPATAPGKRVFLPMKITFGEDTLRLSDSSGLPLWDLPPEEEPAEQ